VRIRKKMNLAIIEQLWVLQQSFKMPKAMLSHILNTVSIPESVDILPASGRGG
jgi:hypothetical protein